MFHSIKILTLIMLVCTSIQLSYASEKTDFCIQTLNTYGTFYAQDLKTRYDHIISFLQNQSCDVTLLQEVWLDKYLKNIQSSTAPHIQEVHFDAIYQERTSGLLTLYNKNKMKMSFSDIVYFPHESTNGFIENIYQKLYRFLDINKGFGILRMNTLQQKPPLSILIVNTHLNHLSQYARVQQLLVYFKWLLSNPHPLSIIITAGDFNFSPDSLEFQIMKHMLRFQDSFEALKQDYECTYLCENNEDIVYLKSLLGLNERIVDYIFFKHSPQWQLKVTSSDVFPKSYNNEILSDHNGIRMEFTISEQTHELDANQIIADFRRTLEKTRIFLENTQKAPQMYIFQTAFASSLTNQFIDSLQKQINQPHSPLKTYLLNKNNSH